MTTVLHDFFNNNLRNHATLVGAGVDLGQAFNIAINPFNNHQRMNDFQITIGNVPLVADNSLTGFDLFKKPSSMVDYFGTKADPTGHGQFFIQFNNGQCWLYKMVPNDILQEAESAESIGKFFHAEIKSGGFDGELVGTRLIRPDDEDEEEDTPDEPDFEEFADDV